MREEMRIKKKNHNWSSAFRFYLIHWVGPALRSSSSGTLTWRILPTLIVFINKWKVCVPPLRLGINFSRRPEWMKFLTTPKLGVSSVLFGALFIIHMEYPWEWRAERSGFSGLVLRQPLSAICCPPGNLQSQFAIPLSISKLEKSFLTSENSIFIGIYPEKTINPIIKKKHMLLISNQNSISFDIRIMKIKKMIVIIIYSYWNQ